MKLVNLMKIALLAEHETIEEVVTFIKDNPRLLYTEGEVIADAYEVIKVVYNAAPDEKIVDVVNKYLFSNSEEGYRTNMGTQWFDEPTMVEFVERDDWYEIEGLSNEELIADFAYQYGIGIGDYVICSCCGSVINLKDIVCYREIGWTDVSGEISERNRGK